MSETPPRKKVARWLGCLIKGPLGCLAFFVGAAVVFVLFLPPALGRLADRSLEEWFGGQHLGSLEIGEAWIGSLYGRQHVKSVILRDPGGEEVVRAELEAPSLGPLIVGDEREFGPVEVRVHRVNLVELDDGTTNLARALAERAIDSGDSALAMTERSLGRRGYEVDVPVPVHFDLVVDRFSASGTASGRGLLENLSFGGSFVWGAMEHHFALEGGEDPATLEPFRVRLSAAESTSERARPWKVVLDAERVPASFADVLACSAGQLGRIHGPRIDAVHAVWNAYPASELAVEELLLTSADAQLFFSGRVDRERRALIGSADERVRIELTPEAPVARQLLAELVPMLSEVRSTSDERLSITASEFFLPLAGGSELRARCEITAPPAVWLLDPALERALGVPAPLELWSEEALTFSVLVEGTTSNVELELPGETGPLSFSGSFDRGARAYRDLRIELPPGLVPGREGAYLLGGTREEPVVSDAEPR